MAVSHLRSPRPPPLPPEWGHSFRPAYFRLGAALAGAVQAQRILALTATATRATEEAIRQVRTRHNLGVLPGIRPRKRSHAVCQTQQPMQPRKHCPLAASPDHPRSPCPSRPGPLQVLRIPEGSVLRDAAVRHNLRLQVLRTSGGAHWDRGPAQGPPRQAWLPDICHTRACWFPPCPEPVNDAAPPSPLPPHTLLAPHPAGGSSQATRERICSLLAPSGPLGSVRSAIVYVAFKEDANQLARLLGVRGVSARAYHAGKDHRVGGVGRVGLWCGGACDGSSRGAACGSSKRGAVLHAQP